jgi:hypothetical protein
MLSSACCRWAASSLPREWIGLDRSPLRIDSAASAAARTGPVIDRATNRLSSRLTASATPAAAPSVHWLAVVSAAVSLCVWLSRASAWRVTASSAAR